MKKIVCAAVGILLFEFMLIKVQALSEEFLFVIDTVGIPRYNAYGKEISEQVYEAYNIFSYSEPQKVTASGQRWKNSKYGFWAKNKGIYKGSGTRGEYYILGYSYSGAVIYNYYFPMDVIPLTPPETWTFYTYPAAKQSWEDKSKYKYEEQVLHMLNSKLMFNDISSRAKADNPKYIKEYNITAGDIGKKLARLDTAATWKTYGMISTRRRISGTVYSQVYLVKPMAADAQAVCNLETIKSYILKEKDEEIVIPITYGVMVENMTGYADKKHIKEIKATLYINNEKTEDISGSKIISVGNEYMLVITRDKFPPNIEHKIEIRVDGYVHTEFSVDGLMQDTKKMSINVFVEPKKIIPVKQTNVMLLEKDVQKWVVSPLPQTIETQNKETIGFVEAGKSVVLKLSLDVNNVENISVYLNNKLLNCEKLLETEKKSIVKVTIPKQTETTLFGIMSLREETNSYFITNIKDIGSRKNEPYILKIVVIYEGKEYETNMLLDVLDTYLSNINTSILVKNYNQAMIRRGFDEWAYE